MIFFFFFNQISLLSLPNLKPQVCNVNLVCLHMPYLSSWWYQVHKFRWQWVRVKLVFPNQRIGELCERMHSKGIYCIWSLENGVYVHGIHFRKCISQLGMCSTSCGPKRGMIILFLMLYQNIQYMALYKERGFCGYVSREMSTQTL